MSTPKNPLPTHMTAIEIIEPGGPEVLKPTRRPVPSPNNSEVLVRICAAGVNRPDIVQRLGLYPPPPGASDIPGLEVAGEIIALGAAVTGWMIGDTVCALVSGGGYAEFCTVDEGSCLPVPKGLSMVEAASLPETYFTVWANTFVDAGLRPGETLLVHGGASGIGVAAIMLGTALGSKVIVTAGSDEKCAACLRLGASSAYNYKTDIWEDAIAKEGGADVVLDMTGGDFVARNLACLNRGGRHVSIAFLRGPMAPIDIRMVMLKRLRLSGSTMKARAPEDKASLAAGLLEAVWPLLESGKIKPVIDAVMPLVDAAKAHQHMESGDHIGKIILKVA